MAGIVVRKHRSRGRTAASGLEVKMIILTTDNLDESIGFYSETLGMALKFRDGAHFAALDGGRSHWRWPPTSTTRSPARWWSGSRPPIRRRRQGHRGGRRRNRQGPYDDAHERRAVVYDNKGNGIVFYSPLNR